MFIKLSEEFRNLSDIDLRAHAHLLEQLLYVHIRRQHLLSLTPVEIARIRATARLGPLACRVLDTIERHSQDYHSASFHADWVLTILPVGSEPRAPLGRSFYVGAEEIGWWLELAPHLFVENAINDGKLYSQLIFAFLKKFKGSSKHVVIRPYNGGGSPLGNIMQDLFGEEIQGICICDRDCSVETPPFPPASTGMHAYNALQSIGRINAQGASNPTNPFFYFIPTAGWGLENYIGPHLLDQFFEANPQTTATRQQFLQTFPAFPLIPEESFDEWWLINFKDSSQASDTIIGHSGININNLNITAARKVEIASLSIPQNAISFIGDSFCFTRYANAINAAFLKDCMYNSYYNAMDKLSRAAMTSLSADCEMRFT